MQNNIRRIHRLICRIPLWLCGVAGVVIAFCLLVIAVPRCSTGFKHWRIKEKLLTLNQVTSEAELRNFLGSPDAVTTATPFINNTYWHEYCRVRGYDFRLLKRFPFIRVHICGTDKQDNIDRINRLLSIETDIFSRAVVIEDYEVTPTFRDYDRSKQVAFPVKQQETTSQTPLPPPTVSLCTAAPLTYHTQFNRITPANVSCLQKLAKIEQPGVSQMVWSYLGAHLALVCWEQPEQILSFYGLQRKQIIGPDRKIIHVAFSSKRDMAAFAENDTRAEYIDLSTQKTQVFEVGHSQPSVTFSPDGDLLATGGYGTSVKLWCTNNGTLFRQYECGEVEGGLRVSFSPDGSLMAVSHRNDNTRIFAVATGELLHILNKPCSYNLAFSPNGKCLAVSYVEGNVGLWDAQTGYLLHTTPPEPGEVYGLAWSHDGDILVTLGRLSSVTLWHGDTLAELRKLPDTRPGSRCIAFHPMGVMILTTTNHYVDVWGCPKQ